MLKMIERLNFILTVNNHQMALELINEFGEDRILSCCARLADRNISSDLYKGCLSIQKELIWSERFTDFLTTLSHIKITKEKINSLLDILHMHGETALDYPIRRLISSIVMTTGHYEIFYDYLKYFSALHTDKTQKTLIVDNLKAYRNLNATPVAELTDDERLILTEPYLSKSHLIPKPSVTQACIMLARQPALKKLIRFLYTNELLVALDMAHYESFSRSPEQIHALLNELYRLLRKNSDVMVELIVLWLENGCPLFDLNTLCVKLKGMDTEQMEAVFETRGSYINFIYGGKINGIPLAEVPGYKEEVLIYAITNKKNSFLRVVEDNYAIFADLCWKSILFNREFYLRHINLNSLNAKNLADCGKMESDAMQWNALETGRSYTFEEIKALYDQPAQYLKLYNKLAIPRVDDRIIVLKQLTKQKLMSEVTDETQIDRLAAELSIKTLSVWREQDFAHITGLKPQDAVELLIYRSDIERFIQQMKNRTDARLTLRNWSSVKNYNTIDEMKGDIVEIDSAWRYLVNKMDFSTEFQSRNQERIIEFLCQNGAYIAKTYYDNVYESEKKESLRRIVKAELMGEFSTLKYYADDLHRELDYPISNAQKTLWAENTELTKGNITVKEYDDFYSTLLMGTMPQRTCLSYIDGQHNECLLSNFDSNKKVLYAYVNGKVAGRAIIRLTKSRYSDIDKPSCASLSFVDLENLSEGTANKVAERERLTLFLERPYSAGVSSDVEAQVMSLFIKLMEQKASQMGVILVLSKNYAGYGVSNYAKTFLYIYISKSKAGAQYLDSLNGSASVSDEGGYKSNDFYIRKADVI